MHSQPGVSAYAAAAPIASTHTHVANPATNTRARTISLLTRSTVLVRAGAPPRPRPVGEVYGAGLAGVLAFRAVAWRYVSSVHMRTIRYMTSTGVPHARLAMHYVLLRSTGNIIDSYHEEAGARAEANGGGVQQTNVRTDWHRDGPIP